MRNLKNIEAFLENSSFEGANPRYPHEINEVKGEGKELDGRSIASVQVSDWLWDFNIEKRSFPKSSAFFTLLNPEEKLSVFAAQVVNSFAIEAWKSIKSKRIFSSAISEQERQKIISKLRGFWGSKKKLELYKYEKEALVEFIKAFEQSLYNGDMGASIEQDSDSIILNRAIDPAAGPMSKAFTAVKSFFSSASWQRALAWLIDNLAQNRQHVKWLNGSIYKPNKLSSGISPDVNTAFNLFVVDLDVQASTPNMENAISAINYAASLVIEESKKLPEQGKDTWMGALYNTSLFGLYQSMLVIGTCAWVYDLIGDTNIMGGRPVERTEGTKTEFKGEFTPSEGLTAEEYDGVVVYRIKYNTSEFKEVLSSLLKKERISKQTYDDYLSQIDSPGIKKPLLSQVVSELRRWGVKNQMTKSEMRGLRSDSSTRIIVPVDFYRTFMTSE